MSRNELRIEVDDRRHVAGGVVRGRLILTCSEGRRCEALEVTSRWGLSTSAPVELDAATEVWSGECAAGETITQPFELTLPAAPTSYEGSLFEVVCWIEARAHLSGAKDPVAQQVIEVVPRTDADPPWNRLYHESSAAVHSANSLLEEARPDLETTAVRIPAGKALQTGCLAALLVPVAVIILLIIAGFYKLISSGAMLEAGALAVMAMMLLVAGFRGAWKLGLGNWVAKRRLGDVEIHLPPRLIRSGQEVPIRLTLRPSHRITISGITARLVAEEQKDAESEIRGDTIRTHTILEQESELSGPRELAAGIPTAISGALLVPDGPPSFSVVRNELNWWLDIRVEIRGGANWESRYRMLMYP